MDRSLFLAQVDLLLRILPYVMRDPRFALKGGSALNLFIRDLPRLSVDIDLLRSLHPS
jgi:Nucleotidyl transferase AbiEii toxin, Type IV TA system